MRNSTHEPCWPPGKNDLNVLPAAGGTSGLNDMQCDYVLLQYCPDIRSSIGRRIGLVFRRSISSRLQVQTPANWQRGIPIEDLDYIQDVFSDLETLDEVSGAEALKELCEMSAGVLRTERKGTCNEQDLEMLLTLQGA